MKRVFAVALLLFPAVAFSAEADEEKGTVIHLDVKIPKPEVSYVLSAPDLMPHYEFELKESFLPNVQESIRLQPF